MDSSEALKIIVAEAARGNLNFPTSAKVALRVRETLDEPNCSIEEAVRLVKAEPLIASRVVALANSIGYNSSGKEIADVRAAVMRLGFAPVRAAAVAVATRQMAGAPADPAGRERAAGLWEHTMHVAALASVIARRVTKHDPEAAMFAGILHEVAGFYLLSRTRDFPGMLDGELTEWLPNDDGEIDGDEGAAGRLRRRNRPRCAQGAVRARRHRARHRGIVGGLPVSASGYARGYSAACRSIGPGTITVARNVECHA